MIDQPPEEPGPRSWGCIFASAALLVLFLSVVGLCTGGKGNAATASFGLAFVLVIVITAVWLSGSSRR